MGFYSSPYQILLPEAYQPSRKSLENQNWRAKAHSSATQDLQSPRRSVQVTFYRAAHREKDRLPQQPALPFKALSAALTHRQGTASCHRVGPLPSPRVFYAQPRRTDSDCGLCTLQIIHEPLVTSPSPLFSKRLATNCMKN